MKQHRHKLRESGHARGEQESRATVSREVDEQSEMPGESIIAIGTLPRL